MLVKIKKRVGRKVWMFFQNLLIAAAVYFAWQALAALDIASVMKAPIKWFWLLPSTVAVSASLYIRAIFYSRGLLPELTDFEVCYATFAGESANLLLPLKLGNGFEYSSYPSEMSKKERLFILLFPTIPGQFALGIFALLSAFLALSDGGSYRHILLTVGAVASILPLMITQVLRALGSKAGLYGDAAVRMNGNEYLIILSTWVCTWLSAVFAFSGAGFSFAVGWRVSILAVAATNLAMFLPTTPGAIGVYEFAAVSSIALMGIEGPSVLAAAVLMHIARYAGILPISLGLYIRRKVKK